MTQTAVIAGVGPGLGASIARKFVDEGCQVGLFARSADYLEELADDLGDDALGVPTDVTDPDAVEAGFREVRDTFGSVDILVNHASGGSWTGLQEISPDQFERAWRTSAYGSPAVLAGGRRRHARCGRRDDHFHRCDLGGSGSRRRARIQRGQIRRARDGGVHGS